MNDTVVLGIHSHVYPGTRGSIDRFLDGHAWISVTRDGRTQTYGLWPDAHPDVADNGAGSDIRRNLEVGQRAMANRYFELDDAQAKRLEAALRENVEWRYTNTCASWARDTVRAVTGRHLDADDVLGFETPRELVDSILELERQQPTAPHAPLPAQDEPRSIDSLSTASLPREARQLLAGLLNDPQRRQAWDTRVDSHQQALDAADRNEVDAARLGSIAAER